VYAIPLLLVAGFFSSFGAGVLRPSLTSLVTQAVARNEQGVVLGLNTSLQSVAQIIGPAIAGVLIDHTLLGAWALFCAACALVGLVVQRSAATTSRQIAVP